jgi:hypothetical protein
MSKCPNEHASHKSSNVQMFKCPNEHTSHKKNHMDNKIDDGFKIHGGEKNDGDSMQQSRCDC